MRDDSHDFRGAVSHNSIGGFDEGAAGIGHVVDEDGDFAADVADEGHFGDFVGAGTFFVDEGEVEVEAVRYRCCSFFFLKPEHQSGLSLHTVGIELPFCASSIRTHDHRFGHFQVLPDPPQRARLGIQIVDGDVEEPLDLARVQVHGDHMVATGGLEHVRHELCRDRRSRLVFLILTSVGEVGDHGCDTSCRSGLACVDDDEKFHETIVDVAGSGRLEDEDFDVLLVLPSSVRELWWYTILISNRLPYSHRGLLVGILQDHNLRQLYPQPIRNRLGQFGVAVARKQFDRIRRHNWRLRWIVTAS